MPEHNIKKGVDLTDDNYTFAVKKKLCETMKACEIQGSIQSQIRAKLDRLPPHTRAALGINFIRCCREACDIIDRQTDGINDILDHISDTVNAGKVLTNLTIEGLHEKLTQAIEGDELMPTGKKKTGTREWATSTVNIQRGCEYSCRYCYAREMAVRFKRCTTENWSNPVIDEAQVEKGYAKRQGVVMFPSTHDITAYNIEECLTVLDQLIASGNSVLVVTKASLSCTKRLCDRFMGRKDQIIFRFTIGSSQNRILSFWEPGAPSFNERRLSLDWAYRCDYRTSVSTEPYLDADVTALYETLAPHVTDSFWIGKLRHLNKRVNMMDLSARQIVEFIQPLKAAQTDEAVLDLYRRLNGKPHIKWKDSIRDVIARYPGKD